MDIICQSCGRNNVVVPLWARTTFKFLEDGSISIIHLTPLESIENKLVDQSNDITCKHCGSNDIRIVFNEHEAVQNQDKELAALEGL